MITVRGIIVCNKIYDDYSATVVLKDENEEYLLEVGVFGSNQVAVDAINDIRGCILKHHTIRDFLNDFLS